MMNSRKTSCLMTGVVCLFALALALPHTAWSQAPGDVNNDGMINRTDLSAIVDHILDRVVAPNPDCNQDSAVDIRDVVCVINILNTLPPPDPGEVAPPVDSTVATTLLTATEFLYTGPSPIQTGVAPGTIDPKRVAVLRGKVLDGDGNPLPNVTITILNHPEYGQTRSRADGMFDMVVNGGGYLNVRYERTGYLKVQRERDIPWQDFMWLPEIRMIQADPNVALVDLTSQNDFQIIRGSVVTDARGTRQSTILIPKGTQAWMVFPDGHEEPITSLNVRATEYTVGADGERKMPAELPPNIAYTYCEEFTVEEAIAAGAPEVRFSQPVISYNENFLDFPVGTGIPLGAYDRERGVWTPTDNGKTIEILSIASGLAELDTDGDGTPDNGVSLGITEAERTTLATLYQAGQTLWRVLVPHFTEPWDKNMGTSCEQPCPNPDTPPPWEDTVDGSCRQEGSIIECQNQALGQMIDVTGTPYRLYYKSDRVPGRTDAFTLNIPLSSAVMSPTLQEITLTARIAGQEIRRRFKREDFDLSNLSYTFTWDGRDAYGRLVQGRQQATFDIGYGYRLIYQATDRFGYNGNGTVITTGSNLFNIRKTHKSWMGIWDARGQGLGGWTLDIHHSYDPQERVIYYGDGNKRSATSVGRVVTTVAGGGSPGDNKPATQSFLYNPHAVAFSRDGSYYIAEGNLVRRVDTDGIITTVAGTGAAGYGGDGGPATAAQLNGPSDVAIGPDGSVYIADIGNQRIRRIAPDGIITTFAGNGNEADCPLADSDVPATETGICQVDSLSFGPDGSLYLRHSTAVNGGMALIRRVGPDGIMSKVAGRPAGFVCYNMTEGARATDADIAAGPIAVGPDGSVYFSSSCGGPRLWRVDVDGKLRRVAGNGSWGSGGDGGPALQASMNYPGKVSFGLDGSIYLPYNNPACVRVISPDGLINKIAGNCASGYGFAGDNGLATQATFHLVAGATPGPDGSLYIVDMANGRIRRVTVAPTLPGISDSDLLIPSEDGAEAYLFNSRGRHLITYNALTAAVKYIVGYNANGFLSSVTDGDGNVTTIERDGLDRPLAIVSPYGQRTTLTLDGNGYLSGITNPASETAQFVCTGTGLMTEFTDPRGGLYQFTYDTRGRLTGETDPAGGSRTLSLTRTATAFDVTHTTGMNRVTNYRVERLGTGDEHFVNIFPPGITTDDLLKKKDGDETVTFPDGTVATQQLGPDPRFGMQAPVLKSQTVAMPSTLTATATTARTATLSISDNPLTITSLNDEFTVNGRRYTTNYNASTKTVTDTSPAGRQVTSKIDSQGRVVEHQITGFLPVQFTYDTQGRLASVKQGSGPDLRESTYQYNAQGYLQTATNPLSQTVSFEYDQVGRVIKEVLPDSRETTYTYDAGGNMTSLTPPGRPSHAFTYTPVDLMAEYIPPDIGIGTVKTQYSYNTDRQLTQVMRPDGVAIDFSYDMGGRLSTVTYPEGVLTYTYDPGKVYLIQINSSDGNGVSYAYDGMFMTSESWTGDVMGSVSWTYDNSFRITGISINGGNTVAYQYNNDSLITRAGDLTLTRNAQNSFLTGSTLGNVIDAWTYNSFGEPATYTARYGANELFKQQFTYDKLSRIAQKIETVEGAINTYDYYYDSTGRLYEVKKNGLTVSTYTYGSSDNRVTHTGTGGTIIGTYDSQDRLMQHGTTAYSYKANGELQSKTTGGQTTLYDYDVFGNLKSVILPGGTLIEYIVDIQNRRIGEKVNGTWVRKFLYLNGLKPVAELDANNAIVSLFVYGSQTVVPDYIVKGEITYRIITDHLGSPRLVINTADGAIAQRMDYDEFGNVSQDSNQHFQPFGFAGGLYDPDTHLVRFGARDYDAEIGRWTAKDPNPFRQGETNHYIYVDNDPLSYTDARGIGEDHYCVQQAKDPKGSAKDLADGAKYSANPKSAPKTEPTTPKTEPTAPISPKKAPKPTAEELGKIGGGQGALGAKGLLDWMIKNGLVKGVAKCFVIFQILDVIKYARDPDAYMNDLPVCTYYPMTSGCPGLRKLPSYQGRVEPGRYIYNIDTGKYNGPYL
jgi:RHS repeat-associated protein